VPRRTVVDAGPLVALFDASDRYHPDALTFIKTFKGELLSTLAVITEVSHLLDFRVAVQIDFIRWVRAGAVRLVDLIPADLDRIIELTEQYADLPMDFADASLVAFSERLGIRYIATVDKDFYVYRINGKEAFRTIFFNPKKC
jgi:predicted nucleic acid-binding protein